MRRLYNICDDQKKSGDEIEPTCMQLEEYRKSQTLAGRNPINPIIEEGSIHVFLFKLYT